MMRAADQVQWYELLAGMPAACSNNHFKQSSRPLSTCAGQAVYGGWALRQHVLSRSCRLQHFQGQRSTCEGGLLRMHSEEHLDRLHSYTDNKRSPQIC
jgi:hypothetical protein